MARSASAACRRRGLPSKTGAPRPSRPAPHIQEQESDPWRVTDIHTTEAVIDNGSFGTRTIRFETGRLARQAAGSVAAYLDDETMLLSATTAGKKPKENLDFFPLTIDVEERMYAAGRIPGSFFRREGRPSEDAILTCRLTDRPLRPSFAKGLRNEVQVVITVLALTPTTCTTSSRSTPRPRRPSSPGCRSAARSAPPASRSSTTSGSPSRPTSELETAVFDMVVAGRVVGDDVAIMMVEAEATSSAWNLIKDEGKTAPTEEVVAAGLEAAKPFIRTLCEAQAELASLAAKPTADLPALPRLRGRRLRGRHGRRQRGAHQRAGDRRQARPRDRARPHQGLGEGEARQPVRGSREGDQRRVPGR